MEFIRRRARSGKAWCFWGERLGVHGLGFLGSIYRRWSFAELHRSNVPIWGIGKWAVEQYRKEFGKGRLYFNVPYFSDLSRFQRTKGNSRPHDEPLTFLYSGSLIRRKGVDLLAEAFGRLAGEFPSVTLKIVGDGALRKEMDSKLTSCRDRVHFMGFQDWKYLPSFYRAADILCVPSRYDGWNLVVPEGLAAGLPVIGTEQTGAAIELIDPGNNGWLIPSDNADALYKAMREAASLSPEALNKRSLAAQMSIMDYRMVNGVNRFNHAADETLRQHIT